MRKHPTPWQYLVDIIGQSRLKTAYRSGNAKTIKQAETYYKGLNEDEVVFTVPRKNPFTSKWSITMTCRGRGFRLQDLAFNTGELIKMIGANASHMARHESLDLSTVTGFYYSEPAEQYHLLIHRDSNIHEALKMTGYEFGPNDFNVHLYPFHNDRLKADGEVNIKHPVVVGKLFITYVSRNLDEEEAAAAEKIKAIFQPVGETGTTEGVGEGVNLAVEGVNLETSGDPLAPAEVKEEPKEEPKEEVKEPAQEEPAPAQNNQQNQQKNKRR